MFPSFLIWADIGESDIGLPLSLCSVTLSKFIPKNLYLHAHVCNVLDTYLGEQPLVLVRKVIYTSCPSKC